MTHPQRSDPAPTSVPTPESNPIPTLEGLDIDELCQLLEGSTDGTWIFEPDVDRVAWSPKLFDLLGYTEPRERFAAIDEIIHPDDRDRHREAVEQVMIDGGQYRIFVRIRGGDGRYRGISVHGLLLPAREGAGRRLVGFLLDATAEFEAKQGLARSEARFRAFMDNCPAAVFLKAEDGRHLYANEMAAAIAGVTVDEIRGHTSAEIFPPDAAKRLREADEAALRADGPISKSETIVTPDGETRHVLDTKFAVPDLDSDSKLVGGFGLDITDLIRKEEEIRELDRRVRDSQRLESIGLLAGGLAHDFNNVLLTVMGNAELAIEEADDERRAAFLKAALERCRHASALCSQLLIYAGKSPNEPRALAPARILEESGELFDMSRSVGVRVDTTITPDLPEIRADEVQVRQVLLNLITNAAHAVGSRKDARIELSCGPGRDLGECDVHHSWAAPGSTEMVTFAVADNGVGIDEADLQRVFEPFYTTKGIGRGLGMPTVLGIVKAHGGEIAVDSSQDRGTTVTVAFPIAHPETPAPGPTTEAKTDMLDLTGSRVLVVDDQPEVRAVASGMIERLGAETVGAESALQALEILASDDAFALAVVDVTMPGMDGLELAERMRTEHPAIPVILTSGYAAEQRDVSGSPFTFLRKPYRLAGLQDAVRAALGD